MKKTCCAALSASLAIALAASAASDGLVADSKAVSAVEYLYADTSDANTILAAIDSGLMDRYQGKDRAAWQEHYTSGRAQLAQQLDALPAAGLTARDAQAIAAMKKQMQAFSGGGALFSPKARCKDAPRKDLAYRELKAALVACFVEIGNSLPFEGGSINRVSALDLLHETSDPVRRKAVFLSFLPLWQALNGNDERDSPYRRMIAGAVADAAQGGSEIDNVARDAGIDGAQVERWLVQILEAWRDSSGTAMIEPWDFRYQTGEADRLLGGYVPRDSLQPINQRYYSDLGADLAGLGTLYDLDPRPNKAALAYTEFVTHGRLVDGKWWPTVARVSAPYERGGLFVLNELVHENGHVANITAIRNRPAFVDWPSDLFAEAFADVPAWSTYEPAWQRRYLGHDAPEQVSLRALYSVVVLDVAWSLFEVRMFRDPGTDPNALWTDITSRYLHIVPHPELSWWAMRVQLADLPGYMSNYGFGAILTAEMRQRIAQGLGAFDTGDPRWYGWLSEHLLRFGSERDTRTLLLDFLGHPVSPQPLLEQMQRLRADDSRAAIPPTAIPAAVTSDPAPDPAHPPRSAQVLVPSHGVGMNGLFYLAAGAGPHPTFVLLHGFPGNEQNLDLAQAIRRAGWNVLTLHYRGSWGSPGDFSISHVLEDTDAAMAFVRQPDIARRFGIDVRRIVLGGHSMGGFATAAHARTDDRLLGVVLLDAWNVGAQGDEFSKVHGADRAAMVAKQFDDLGNSLHGATATGIADEIELHRSEWNFLPWAGELAHRPLLVIGAAQDYGAQNRELADAVARAGGKVTALTLPSDHSFQDHRIALAAEVVRWLQELTSN